MTPSDHALLFGLRRLQGMFYRRICRFIPVQINIEGKMNIYLDSKYAISFFTEIFASRVYAPALELFQVAPRHVLDLGAHEGLFSLFVEVHVRQRFPNTRVQYSLYEANPQLMSRIERNLILAEMRQQCQVYCGAVGRRSGQVTFGISRNLACSGIEPSNPAIRHIRVSYLDIEAQLEKRGLCVPELIKVDIEGSERDLFMHYPEFLAQTCVVAVEFHGHAVDRKEWEGLIKAAGLEIHEITGVSGLTTHEILVNPVNLAAHNARITSNPPEVR